MHFILLDPWVNIQPVLGVRPPQVGVGRPFVALPWEKLCVRPWYETSTNSCSTFTMHRYGKQNQVPSLQVPNAETSYFDLTWF